MHPRDPVAIVSYGSSVKKKPKGQMHFFIFTEQPMSLPVSLGFHLNVFKRDIFDDTALNSLKIGFSSDLER